MWATIIVAAAIAVAAALAVAAIVKRRKNGKTGCGCDCRGCSMKSDCGKKNRD